MRVLAIDPGYDRCGVAILERQSGKDTLLFSTCIETDRSTDFATRLTHVADSVSDYIKEFNPTHVAIEKLYFTNNQKTAMGVSEVRGAIQYIAKSAHMVIREFTPGEVKVAVTGAGNADKKQVIAMIGRLVRLEKPITHDDEYDAIGIGITCLAHHR
ncbi:MAG: crossover junction endodeoxyribonuclease RuvC [Candidatus Pacebacteria bacterium]|nr:crossover junction endodeoxyribonuclease RuvC [Candidatus Paceibacterota bacterium]